MSAASKKATRSTMIRSRLHSPLPQSKSSKKITVAKRVSSSKTQATKFISPQVAEERRAQFVFWREHGRALAKHFAKKSKLKPYQRRLLRLVEDLNKINPQELHK